jgi:hypothetical protein
MPRAWHEYDPRRNSTKIVKLVAPGKHYRDKEESNFDYLVACYPVSSGIMIWGYGTVILAMPIV